MPNAIKAEGLNELRRDLKAIDKKLPRELTKAQREALKPTAAKAAGFAPRRPSSGRLAASIRPFATARSAGLRSPLPYANVQHWGGNVGRNKATHVRATFFAFKAVRGDLDDIVERMGDAIDALAKRHGFN